MIEDSLTKLGFSPSETKAYLHLLRTGRTYANRLSAETKINRTNVYEALERLAAKGMVSFITRNKVKWFEANAAESLMALIKEKEDNIRDTKIVLLKDIDMLRRSINPDKKPLEANVFVGKKGLRMLFEDILETKKPISFIAAELQFKSLFGPYFELWHKQRIEKKIRQRTIFPARFKGKVEIRRFLEYKFVDNKFTNPTTTIIYGDNCLFIQWSREPIAIKISNKEIAKSHVNYFNMLWNS